MLIINLGRNFLGDRTRFLNIIQLKDQKINQEKSRIIPISKYEGLLLRDICHMFVMSPEDKQRKTRRKKTHLKREQSFRIVDNELIRNSLIPNGTDYWARLLRGGVNHCSLWVAALRTVLSNSFHSCFSICITEESVLKM